MNDNYIYPDLIIRKGEGSFSSGNIAFNAAFEILHYPQNTTIEVFIKSDTDRFKILLPNNNWELVGKVDPDLDVLINDLHRSKEFNGKFVFRPYNEIRFGSLSDNNFTYAEFPLGGFYYGKIDIVLDNWHISTIEHNSNAALLDANSFNWNTQFEGLSLILRNNSATIEDYQSKANNITMLLSLAVGNDIAFNRQIYYNDESFLFEIWRRKVDYNFGVKPCIPDSEINDYLNKTLSRFEKWNKKKKDRFYSVINYINSSNKGFLEERLLGLCIAWESLTSGWIKLKKEKNEELNSLKESLKCLIDNFNLPKEYDKELIKNRILLALDWERLNSLLINLLNHYELDQEKLGFDFKTLIKIRNDIAHSGQFRKKYSKRDLVDLINNNKLGLQIVLLKELGYDGIIVCKIDKRETKIKIDELIKNPAHNTA